MRKYPEFKFEICNSIQESRKGSQDQDKYQESREVFRNLEKYPGISTGFELSEKVSKNFRELFRSYIKVLRNLEKYS